MKRLVTSLIILICFTSLSFAQGMMQQKQGKGMMSMKGRMKGHMMGGMHPMMYSMMVHHVLMKANTLNLTETQKKELNSIKEKYVFPMVRKESEFKISHMKIIDMLQNPSFDPASVKKEIKTSNNINLEIANMAIDALAATRKTIGLENFTKIKGMMPTMSGKMMEQMKQEKKEETQGNHKEHHKEQ